MSQTTSDECPRCNGTFARMAQRGEVPTMSYDLCEPCKDEQLAMFDKYADSLIVTRPVIRGSRDQS